MLLTSKTLAQLQAQILPTKRDALIALNNGLAKVPDASIITYAKDGQIANQTDVDRDVETGAMVGGRVVTWTYYKTGEVDVITISARDANNKEVSLKTIKHFTDGRQPTVS